MLRGRECYDFAGEDSREDDQVLTSVEGVYRNGEVELFERPEGLDQARVIVTFLPRASRERAVSESRDRMLARMRQGLPLGGPPYPTREEIYRRGDSE